MKISKAHKRYSERLNRPEVLTNPEEFLGPNYKAVLDFWLILDDLTEDQLETIWSRLNVFYDKPCSEFIKTIDEAIKASEETIGWEFATNAACAAYDVGDVYECEVYHATKELIGMHLILNQNKPLTFFNMFLVL